MPEDFSWVTSEMFDNKLDDLIHELGVAYIVGLSGVYEIVREELNNQVLEELEAERDD